MPVPIIHPASRGHLFYPLVAGLALLGITGSLVALVLQVPHRAAFVLSPVLAVTPASAWLGPATLGLLRPWPLVVGSGAAAVAAVLILSCWWRWSHKRSQTPSS